MTEVHSGSRSKIIYIVLGALLLALLLGLLIRSLTHRAVAVRTVTVNFGDLVSSIATNGRVEPVQVFQAHAPEPAVVQAVYVREGQEVPAGTLLLRLDSSSAEARVAAARASVATAQANAADVSQGGSREEQLNLASDMQKAQMQATQAENDLRALQQLQARGAASASEVAQAQQRLSAQQAQLQALRQRQTSRFAATDTQRVRAAVQDSHAALAAAEQTLSQNVIRAPYAGTVYSLPVKQYDYVTAGEELLHLADLHHVQVRAYFDEPEIGKLELGQNVEVKWDAKPDRLWHGHITHVPTTVITSGTRNVGECIIAIDDTSGDLLPNINVNVKVTVQQKPHVLSIPREALHTQGSDDFVYVLQHGRLHRRSIQVGSLNLMLVEVKGGLRDGDTVALNAVTNDDLVDGLEVKAVRE